MSEESLHTWLAQTRAAVSGEYSSISRVVDALLDLRSLAADRPVLVAMVDETIAAIPGRTVAPNQWWSDRLDGIEIQLERPGDGNREPLASGAAD